MRVYRAANDDFLMQGFSFAEIREDAEAYLDNPNFGGSAIYVCDIPSDHSILDITDDPWNRLSELAGREIDPSCGAGMVSQAIQFVPHILDTIAEAGYDWVRYVDDFPPGCVTYTACSGRASELPVEPEED